MNCKRVMNNHELWGVWKIAAISGVIQGNDDAMQSWATKKYVGTKTCEGSKTISLGRKRAEKTETRAEFHLRGGRSRREGGREGWGTLPPSGPAILEGCSRASP